MEKIEDKFTCLKIDLLGTENINDFLHYFELKWKVLLTIHDIFDYLIDYDGTCIINESFKSHRNNICTKGRPYNSIVEKKCIDHCWKRVNMYAAEKKIPFIHKCWRNVYELVVPIFHNNTHCMSLFLNPLLKQDDKPSKRKFYSWLKKIPLNIVITEANMIGNYLLSLSMNRYNNNIDKYFDNEKIIKNYLIHNYRNPDIIKLAKILGVSVSRAYHMVKNITGKSWRQQILEIRIERAKRYLHQKSFSISKIAELCGYSEPCTFIRAFRKITGLSPSAWRNRIKHKGR